MPRIATPTEVMFGLDCAVEGCNYLQRAGGRCDTHYRRWKRYGNDNTPDQRKTPEHGYKGWNTRRAKGVSKDVG